MQDNRILMIKTLVSIDFKRGIVVILVVLRCKYTAPPPKSQETESLFYNLSFDTLFQRAAILVIKVYSAICRRDAATLWYLEPLNVNEL